MFACCFENLWDCKRRQDLIMGEMIKKSVGIPGRPRLVWEVLNPGTENKIEGTLEPEVKVRWPSSRIKLSDTRVSIEIGNDDGDGSCQDDFLVRSSII